MNVGHFDPDKAQSVPTAEVIKYVLPLPRDRQEKTVNFVI